MFWQKNGGIFIKQGLKAGENKGWRIREIMRDKRGCEDAGLREGEILKFHSDILNVFRNNKRIGIKFKKFRNKSILIGGMTARVDR